MARDQGAPRFRGREIRLVRRPQGVPVPSDFAMVNTVARALGPDEVVVRNTWLSVDPYMRGKMNGEQSSGAPYQLGAALYGRAIGEVVASTAPDLPMGAIVRHPLGWRELSVVPAPDARIVDVSRRPAEEYLGALGMVGLTAYAGLIRYAPVRTGDTVFISAASGAVGGIAARIARHLGAARIVGSAGGPDKVALLTDELGYDAGIDYRRGDLVGQLRAAAPDGIDVYFDNVGYEHLAAAIDVANPHARIALCGWIAGYNSVSPRRAAPDNLALAVGKRLSLRGFSASDNLDLTGEWEQLAVGWLDEGSMTARSTIVDGFDNTVEAFLGLFHGANTGKMLVRL